MSERRRHSDSRVEVRHRSFSYGHPARKSRSNSGLTTFALWRAGCEPPDFTRLLRGPTNRTRLRSARQSRCKNAAKLLRLRKYGDEWLLTHKAKGKVARHKTRVETETQVADGENWNRFFGSLGYVPCLPL